MKRPAWILFVSLFLFSFISISLWASTAHADTTSEINRDVASALQKLYKSNPAALELKKVAKGILVFPSIVKGGFIIGGQYGLSLIHI